MQQESMPPEKIAARTRYSFPQDFQALVMASDGITDPFFPSEDSITSGECWKRFWTETLPNGDNENPGCRELFDPSANAADSERGLLKWLEFWVKGEHDDRTILVLSERPYAADLLRDRPESIGTPAIVPLLQNKDAETKRLLDEEANRKAKEEADRKAMEAEEEARKAQLNVEKAEREAREAKEKAWKAQQEAKAVRENGRGAITDEKPLAADTILTDDSSGKAGLEQLARYGSTASPPQLTGAPQDQAAGTDKHGEAASPQSLAAGADRHVEAGSIQDQAAGTGETTVPSSTQSQAAGTNETVSTGSPKDQATGSDETPATGSPQDQAAGAGETATTGSSQGQKAGADADNGQPEVIVIPVKTGPSS
jgi:hypothetical protein